MILRALADYADTLDIPPEGYDLTWVQWFVDLDEAGRFQGLVPLATEGKGGRRGRQLLVPQLRRTSGVAPLLLADKATYVLGLSNNEPSAARAMESHKAFIELTRVCVEETDAPDVRAVLTFLDKWDADPRPALPAELAPGEVLTFRVHGRLPVDLPAVQRFWAQRLNESTGPVMFCLVCGQKGPVQRRLPTALKGIPGGQTSGTAISSANSNAYESYGLEASLTSPMCRTCAERFGKAANRLLASPSSRLIVGSTVYVFWRSSSESVPLLTYLTHPTVSDVKELFSNPDALAARLKASRPKDVNPGLLRRGLQSGWSGRPEALAMVPEDVLFGLGLTASGGRVVVREWFTLGLPEAVANLRRWFSLQNLIDPWGGDGEPLGIFALASSLYRESRDVRSDVVTALLGAALAGRPLPDRLLAQTVQRCRVEQEVTRPRAALLKMLVLDRAAHRALKEDDLMSLNPHHPDPGYQCGRLMAQIESIQRAALPGIKQTVMDRYYGTVSTAPAQVVGVLIRQAQNHLGRLRKERPGAYQNLQRDLEEILGEIGPYIPRTLDLNEQGLFALGYYHQRAANRAAAASRRTGASIPTDNTHMTEEDHSDE